MCCMVELAFSDHDIKTIDLKISEETKKRSSDTWKTAKKLFYSALILEATVQIIHTGNEIRQNLFPSEYQQETEEMFGFKILNIPNNLDGHDLTNMTERIMIEKQEKDFELDKIRIIPAHYLEQSFLDHLGDIFTTGYDGYYANKVVGLQHDFDPQTLTHELKHRKTFEVIAEHPEFLEKWKALAVDEDGNSIYKTGFQQAATYIKILNNFAKEDPLTTSESIELGFMSDYARTNVYEDIAVLCETAEEVRVGLSTDFGSMVRDDSTKGNILIKKKLELAQEYGLLPEEFSEYMVLKEDQRELYLGRMCIDGSKVPDYIEKIEDFLERYPESTYKADLTYDKCRFMRTIIPFEEEEAAAYIDNIVSHLKEGLEISPKYWTGYGLLLTEMEKMYRHHLNDPERASIYEEAQVQYFKRREEGDLSVLKNGVNDFLREKGEL